MRWRSGSTAFSRASMAWEGSSKPRRAGGWPWTRRCICTTPAGPTPRWGIARRKRRTAWRHESMQGSKGGAEIGHYQLHAFVIMSNHVHLLLTPHINVSKLLCSLKTATAKRANLLLRRTGQPFWQDESYDHLVRNGEEFRSIQRYIENNPVAASLVASQEQYAWSSAGRPARPPQAESLPH